MGSDNKSPELSPITSRRNFFKRFIPQPASIDTSSESESVSYSSKTMSRRSAFKFFGGLGAALLGAQVGARLIDKQILEGGAVEEGLLFSSTKAKTDVKSYGGTIIESSLVNASDAIAMEVFKRLGVNTEFPSKLDLPTEPNKEQLDKYLDSIPSVIAKGVVLAPLLEELIYRVAPSAYAWEDEGKMRWDIGIPSAAIFALVHNLKTDKEIETSDDNRDQGSKDIPVQFEKAVPVSQFMGGLFYWYLMRKRGYSHAVLAHSIHNSAVGALNIADALNKRYPNNSIVENQV